MSERPGPLALSSPSSERGTRRLHDCASRPRQLGSQWPESGSLPGSPGRPAYLSLLVQWHLDRGQLPVMVRPCSRGISESVHTPVNLSAGVTQAPGTALSGKGPCVGLLKPKVKRRHCGTGGSRMQMLSPYKTGIHGELGAGLVRGTGGPGGVGT